MDHGLEVRNFLGVCCFEHHASQLFDQLLIPRSHRLSKDDRGVALHDVLDDDLAHGPEAFAVPVRREGSFKPARLH